MKYCSNCGNEIKENEDICLKCGILLKNGNNQNINNPGKGLSIAGMILGIISLLLTIITL